MKENLKWAEQLMLCFPIGQRVELVSFVDISKASPSDIVSRGLDVHDVATRKKMPKVLKGTPGTVRHIDGTCQVDVLWDTGVSTKIIAGFDFIRAINIPVIVRRPNDPFHMSPWELAEWANIVHRIAGGSGNAFAPTDFPYRLKGHHCSCGVSEEGYTNGVFELLPYTSEEVKEGGKAYMRCTKCGSYSHL